MLVIALGLAAVAGGLFFFTISRAGPPEAVSEPIVPQEAAAAPASKPKATAPDAKAEAAPQPKAAAEAAPKTGSDIPPALARALRKSGVVVVALYLPRSRVDAIAAAEAAAGAKVAGAGFVGINVLDEDESRPLVEKIGVLGDPSVLVYSRPAELKQRLEGFADRQTVAQAAATAARS